MTVPRPKFSRNHPRYQLDFEEAARPAIHALIVVAESAGWAPDVVATGLFALVRAHLAGIATHDVRQTEIRNVMPAKIEPPNRSFMR